MHTGLLKDRIGIYKDTGTTRDAAGEPVESWTLLKTVWAARNYKRGGESYEADKLTAYSDQTFTLHSTEAEEITRDMRIMHGSTTFEIKQKETDFEPGFTRIYATEKF